MQQRAPHPIHKSTILKANILEATLASGLLLCWLTPVSAAAQIQYHGNTVGGLPQVNPDQDEIDKSERMKRAALLEQNRKRRKQAVAQSQRLLDLARQLQTDMDAPAPVPTSLANEAEQIEKLAKSIGANMKPM